MEIDFSSKNKIKKPKKKNLVPLEKSEQKAFVRWFKLEYPGIVIMSIRNDGSRTVTERVEQMEMGLHKGAADLYIPAWHCWVEMKRVKDAVLRAEQEAFRDYVLSIGDQWICGHGCDDAINKLKFVDKK